ncbi:hypothetical protein PsYK624_082580 [Phanerochaete sordida]|uniref:Uncharacterized protein n=1 Tax=Phanerochaete sordida TaxID=48140 RepID=A0A9P3GCE9_9APHY|nr:hypothetical protein PsYK624_082580 [Phanerochaete sordida]
MAQPAHAPLALDEPWILKTKVRKVFNFSDNDFGCLQVRHEQTNPNGGAHPMVKLSLREVKALALRLQEALGVQPAPGVLAPRSGQDILHSKAMKEFGLTTGQLKAIAPVNIQANPHGRWQPPMKHYNRTDVLALADRLATARAQHAATWA